MITKGIYLRIWSSLVAVVFLTYSLSGFKPADHLQKNESSPDNRLYGVKSGRITYVDVRPSAEGVTDTSVVTFDDFGKLIHYQFGSKEIMIFDLNAKKRYHLYNDRKQCSVNPLESDDGWLDILFYSGDDAWKTATRIANVKIADFRKIPNRIILDKDCSFCAYRSFYPDESDSFELETGGWKRIPFWIDAVERGRLKKAIAFTENISIPADFFTPPLGYQNM